MKNNTETCAMRVLGLLIGSLATSTAWSANPEFLGRWPGYARGNAQAVAVSGGFAYLAVGSGGIHVVDVRNPNSPITVAHLDTAGSAAGVAVSGKHLFVADGDAGLQVVDVSNPVVPVRVGGVDTSGFAFGVAVLGDFAYVADGSAGLQVVKISDPTRPVRVGGAATSGTARSVAVAGNFAYVAADDAGLQVINVSNPERPTTVGGLDTAGYARSIALFGNFVCLTDWNTGLQIIDVSNPAIPLLTESVATSGSAMGVTVAGHHAYVVDRNESQLHIVDLSNPAQPVRVGGASTVRYAYSVVVTGSTVLVAAWDTGLQVFDAGNPASPSRIGNVDTSGFARGVATSGNFAYLADSYDGLQAIDVNQPANPVRAGGLHATMHAFGVAIVGDHCYLADVYAPGLQVINVADPANPIGAGSYGFSPNARGVAAAGNFAYVANGDLGLRIFDVSTRATPVLSGSVGTSGFASGIAVSGDYAYVADFGGGLQIIAVSNPASPVRVGGIDFASAALGVAVSGSYAYVAADYAGLEIFNVSDPTRPVRVGGFKTGGNARGVALAGPYACVADGSAGLQIIDVRNPTNPVRVGGYDTSGEAMGVAALGDHVFVADGEWGMSVFRLKFPPGANLPPEITLHPQSRTNEPGATAGFRVTTTGTSPLSYQWRRDGANLNNGGRISGARTAALTLAKSQIADTGGYSVVISNVFGVTTSLTAWLTVQVPPTDRLVVTINGRGRVSPNYNGRSLRIGKRFTMTAVPGTGFAFTNWTGSISTNRRFLTFVMQSNLTFTANMVDIRRPVISISVKPRLPVATNMTVVRGKASDNGRVTNVWWRVGNGDYQSAQTTNGWRNWSANIPLEPRTNLLQAYSVDAVGRTSTVARARIYFTVLSPLDLSTNGQGTLARRFKGNLLEVGNTYRLTANPRPGNLFSNWTGTVSSTNPALTFRMQSNMVLRANFVASPFLPLKGTYYGLFYPSIDQGVSNSGYYTLTLTERGTFSGQLKLAGATHGFSGGFNLDQQANVTVKRTGAPSLQVSLQFHPSARAISGTVSNDLWTSALRTDLMTAKPALTGLYTLLTDGLPGGAGVPTGHASGTVTVSPNGSVRTSGRLPDGTAFSHATALGVEGQWPLFAAPYPVRGLLLGWMGCNTNAPAQWIKPSRPTYVFYPAGFALTKTVVVAKYTAPARGESVLPWANGMVTVGGGNLTNILTNLVFLTNNQIKALTGSISNLTLSVSANNGQITGRFIHPLTGKPTSLAGALVQDPAHIHPLGGGGWFLGTNEGGFLRLEPSP